MTYSNRTANDFYKIKYFDSAKEVSKWLKNAFKSFSFEIAEGENERVEVRTDVAHSPVYGCNVHSVWYEGKPVAVLMTLEGGYAKRINNGEKIVDFIDEDFETEPLSTFREVVAQDLQRHHPFSKSGVCYYLESADLIRTIRIARTFVTDRIEFKKMSDYLFSLRIDSDAITNPDFECF